MIFSYENPNRKFVENVISAITLVYYRYYGKDLMFKKGNVLPFYC